MRNRTEYLLIVETPSTQVVLNAGRSPTGRFAGLTPQEFQSGTSVPGKTGLCKLGNTRWRNALLPSFHHVSLLS